jgi:hypothetical protein
MNEKNSRKGAKTQRVAILNSAPNGRNRGDSFVACSL